MAEIYLWVDISDTVTLNLHDTLRLLMPNNIFRHVRLL